MQQELKYPEVNRQAYIYLNKQCLRVDSIFEKRFLGETPKEYYMYLNFRACEVLNLNMSEEFNVTIRAKPVFIKTTNEAGSIEECYIVGNLPGEVISRQVVFYGKDPEAEEDPSLCLITK